MSSNRNGGWTRLMYEKATKQHLSLQDAAKQLIEDAHVRPIRETLAACAQISAEDDAALRKFWLQALQAACPGDKTESIQHKLKQWLHPETLSISKEGAIQVCFALKLSAAQGNELLPRLCADSFHWRDPEEIVYLYALGHEMNYTQARELFAGLKEKNLIGKKPSGKPEAYTAQVRAQVQEIGGVEELEAYLSQSQDMLDSYHNTAYELFVEYMELLGAPNEGDMAAESDAFTTRDIMEEYLHQSFIPRVKRASKNDPESQQAALSALQRSIRQNWPEETVLSRMLHREADVTRKVLILLFLATDGGMGEYGDDVIGVQEEGDAFEDMRDRLEAMLADCSFAPLDSRVPFDWMVLYCMCAAEESMYIDGKVQRFLARIFPMTGKQSELSEEDE